VVGRLTGPRRTKVFLRSRWGAFAVSGLAAGLLLLVGMRVQADSAPSLESVLTSSKGSKEDLTIWILFQRLDCVSSRWKIEGWNELARADRIRVVGLALDSPEGWPAEIDPVNRLQVSFEVLAGPSPAVSRALPSLGVSATPAVLAVDNAGRLRRVVPGDVIRSPEDLQEIVDHVEAVDW